MKSVIRTLKLGFKLLLLLAFAGGAYYTYNETRADTDAEIDPLPEVVVEQRDIVVSVSATGILEPIRVVDVKSKASGEIIDMPVDVGDTVQRGELIAQVDTRILEQELRQAEADHQSAEIRAAIAARQYERARSLRAQDLISDNELEASEQSYTGAEAQLLRAEASLQLVLERLEDATVTAPISGTIIAKQVEEGTLITSSTSNVSGGTALVQMADLSVLEVRTLVDEIDIGRLRPGLPVEMTVEAFPDRRFSGEVRQIEPQAVIEQSVTTFPVLSRVDNSDGLLLPGMNSDVTIVIRRRPDVVAVPNEAVRTPQEADELIALLGLEGDQATGAPAARAREGSGSRDARDAGAPNGRAVVFVRRDAGGITPLTIVTGVNDWEYTEVVSGVEPGTRLTVLPSTSLLESQESLRRRFSSPIPGVGGGGRRWR